MTSPLPPHPYPARAGIHKNPHHRNGYRQAAWIHRDSASRDGVRTLRSAVEGGSCLLRLYPRVVKKSPIWVSRSDPGRASMEMPAWMANGCYCAGNGVLSESDDATDIACVVAETRAFIQNLEPLLLAAAFFLLLRASGRSRAESQQAGPGLVEVLLCRGGA